MAAINYKQVLDLGFKRHEQHDEVFFNTYGFGYYLMYRKLFKGITAWWDINTREVKILRCNKEGDILGTINISSVVELVFYINFFTNEKVNARS